MSNEPQAAGPSTNDLQFDRADFAGPSAAQTSTCNVCGETLRGHYYEINDKIACERCRHGVEAAFNRRPGARGFFKAAFAGLGAAVAGSIVYYAVREGTGYEFGLISVLVGYAVGYAVRWGSRARGGWVYQSLAIFLTYMAIVSTYIPAIFAEIQKQTKEKPPAAAPASANAEVRPAAASNATPVNGPAQNARKEKKEEVTLSDALLAFGALFLLLLALPFLAGFKNIIGLAIIAFGLYEAWKLNRRTTLSISGPFTIKAAATSS